MLWHLQPSSKTMRVVFACFLLFSGLTATCQSNFGPMPEGTKEIHFTYTRSLNMKLNEEGLFADTLFIKTVLKVESFEIRKSEKDTTALIGFIPIQKLKEDFTMYKYLKSLLYHTNETYYGIYYIAENKTVIKAIRGDAESRSVFKNIFKESFEPFDYTVEYDFKLATCKLNFPSVHYENNLYEKIQKITQTEVETIAYTHEVQQGVIYKNIITMNKALSPFVSPKHFDNFYGITKIESVQYTTNLIALNYR